MLDNEQRKKLRDAFGEVYRWERREIVALTSAEKKKCARKLRKAREVYAHLREQYGLR